MKSRSVLYTAIGIFTLAVAVFAYLFYQERQKTAEIEINIGERGLSIETK